VHTSMIDFIDLKTQYKILKESINKRIQGVLDHGQYIMGPEVRELEQALAAYTNSPHCITVASGTEALLISLMALGIKAGDEVITTPFTFVATAEVVALLGATPVFVDIELDTYTIDPTKIEAAISPKTKAIIPVSLYGQTSDMDMINAIAENHGNIAVIEDAAQSFGATYRNRKSCALSKIGCTSFFPSKPLGCYGDGGAIFTSDDDLAKQMREIRIHGQERRYYHTSIGVGGRMDTLQCAIVLAKLENFAWELDQRFALGERYLKMLSNITGLRLPIVRSDSTCVWGQFTLRAKERQHVLDCLKSYNIPTAIHYSTVLHHQPAYRNISRISGSLEHSEKAAQEVFSIPMHPYMTLETQNIVVQALERAYAIGDYEGLQKQVALEENLLLA